MRNKNKGFTIVEILIACVVVSILMVIGVANFRDYIKRQNVKSTAEEIVADLRLAQSEAVKMELRYAASFTAENMTIKKDTTETGSGGADFKAVYFKESMNVTFSNGKSVIILQPTGFIDFALNKNQDKFALKPAKTNRIAEEAFAAPVPVGETVIVTISCGKNSVYIDIQKGGKISLRY